MYLQSLVAAILFAGPMLVCAAETARDRLVERIEKTADRFCKTHNTSGSLHEAAIKVVPDSGADNPNLLVRYYYIQCAGVDKAPMQQGGFCGLTMEGMKCQVEEYAYRNGDYVKVRSYMESPLQ